MPARSLALLFVLFAALALSACGNKEAVVTKAETEGIYLDVGELDYQVQGSRILNPEASPDRQYLTGLGEDVEPPSKDETWFAVFLRVQNQTEEEHTPASVFEIVDTQEKSFEPLDIDPEANAFAYQPVPMAPGDKIPGTGTLTEEGPVQGAMLLFKLPYETLQNRPLEFKIRPLGGIGEEGIVDLDV
jgi:hypothetical protein